MQMSRSMCIVKKEPSSIQILLLTCGQLDINIEAIKIVISISFHLCLSF